MSRASVSQAGVSYALTILVVGCARDPLDEAAWEASRHGTAVTVSGRGTATAPLAAATKVMGRYYWIAKYQATIEQRQNRRG